MKDMPWFKFFPDDWINDTRCLSSEARGAYVDCLCLIYKTERPISQDAKWMGHYLHMSPRKWAAIRTELVAGGFLAETEAGLDNPRARSEVEKRAKNRRTNAEIATNRERKRRENSENANPINKTEARKQHYIETTETETETEERKPPVSPPLPDKRKRGARLPDDWVLPKSWGDWVLTNFPQANPQSVRDMAEDFADYWHAAAGQKGVKLDWQATWRRWARSNLKTAPVRGGYKVHNCGYSPRPGAIMSSSGFDMTFGYSPDELEAMRHARPAE